MDTIFGIPMPIIGFFCFVIAGVFYYVWPRPKPGETRGLWLNMGLHYLHPLAWVLLAMAAFLQHRSTDSALAIAALGGLVYLSFLALLVRRKSA